MKKITNKQLEELSKITAIEVGKMLSKIRTHCPKTMSGRHSWSNWGRTGVRCDFCDIRKNK